MAEKLLTVVVCDLCKKDRPASATVEIDVCSQHDAAIHDRQSETLRFECSECGAKYAHGQGLGAHRRATGHEADKVRHQAKKNDKAAKKAAVRRVG